MSIINTDTVGSNTFIEWRTTGSHNNLSIIIQKEDDNLGDHSRDVRFQVLTAASMMFRAVFWVVLPCK
jgi:hypothetical protein